MNDNNIKMKFRLSVPSAVKTLSLKQNLNLGLSDVQAQKNYELGDHSVLGSDFFIISECSRPESWAESVLSCFQKQPNFTDGKPSSSQTPSSYFLGSSDGQQTKSKGQLQQTTDKRTQGMKEKLESKTQEALAKMKQIYFEFNLRKQQKDQIIRRRSRSARPESEAILDH